MSQQIIIAEQARIAALLTDDRVDELIVAQGQYQIGDIFLGTVENVLPGIDAAFIDIGESEKNGFIHVSDLGPLRLKKGTFGITELLEPKQKVLVQVIKEPTGSKGPRLTGSISIPGKYLILQPYGQGVNISRKINTETERSRLKALGVLIKPPSTGLLFRTESEKVKEELLIEDLEQLIQQWENILKVSEGIISDVKIRFPNSDCDFIIDGKPIKGKTKDCVIKRELKTQPGSIFNRKILESDINRLYATSLFDDVKVSLGPDNLNPGQVIIFLDLSEQRTGSLTGGLGYSNGSGIFASLGLQETNALGRAWKTNLNLNFGEYSTTYNFSLSDPWIKGDKHKTSFRTNIFLSRVYPQEFKSESNGRLYAVDDTSTSTSDTFSSVVLEKTGGGFSFSRPLNGGDPFKVA